MVSCIYVVLSLLMFLAILFVLLGVWLMVFVNCLLNTVYYLFVYGGCFVAEGDGDVVSLGSFLFPSSCMVHYSVCVFCL